MLFRSDKANEKKMAALSQFDETDSFRELCSTAREVSSDATLGDALFSIGEENRTLGQSSYATGCGKLADAEKKYAEAEALRAQSYFTAATSTYAAAVVGFDSVSFTDFQAALNYWRTASDNFLAALFWYYLDPPPMPE